jgi:MFS family permease
LLRITQGLALGGEYEGAAIYIAENISDTKRGYWTSYIQVAASLGLVLSSLSVLVTRLHMSQESFGDWGWRIPFLFSSLLLIVAIIVRWRLKETILFSRLKELNKTSKFPIRESLTNKRNLTTILLVVLIVSGASVVWHTGQFYSSIYMQSTLKMNFVSSSTVTLVAISLGTPFFIFFGWLSDKIGRVRILLLGNILAAISYYPIYAGMKFFSDPLNLPAMIGLVFVQILFSAMCYGPLAAFLVERFQGRIRYTSISIAYGIGTGDIGDATLLIVPAIIFATTNIYLGLVWSTAVPIITSVVGFFLIREKNVSIWSEVDK